MRNVLFAALVGLVATPAWAEVTVEVSPPSITFEAPPPLVEIAPGVQVVPDFDEEVFFVDGYYWTRRGDHWYRTRDYRGGWTLVQDNDVPPSVSRIPRGKYKHFKRRKEHGAAEPSGDDDRAREERARDRVERRDERARSREERERERERPRSERNRAQSTRSGPEVFPGNNEFSVHIGYQAGFAGKFDNPSGFKLFAEYARRFSDLVWLDVQANNVFGIGPSVGTCYDRMGRPFPCGGYYYGGWDFELAIGVKLKIKTKIPLVVEIPILAALEVAYNRQCGDTGAAPALRVGGGVKYFVTRSIGIGGGIDFALGPGFHAGSNCFNSYTDFYGAFDFQMGAEFVF